MDMNFSRQMELFDAENNNEHVVVVGAGATGGWVDLCLAKLGIKSLTIIDDDIIELHNIPNQFYSKDQVNMFKVAATKDNLENFGSRETNIFTSGNRLTKDNILTELFYNNAVFCLVDSMKSRKEIFETLLEHRKVNTSKNNLPKLWIETRMGLTGYRIYLIDLENEYQVEEYRKTLYSDDEAEVSACGASQSIITTAMQCASHTVGLYLAKLNEAEYVPNELIYDIQSSIILHREFKNKEEE